MNPHVYNVSCLVAVLLCGAGAGVQWGIGLGMIVAGGLVLGVTAFGVALFGIGVKR